MEIKTERLNDTIRVKITGDAILAETRDFKGVFQDTKGVSAIYFDLADVSYANSSFLSWILGFKKQHPKIKIRIVNPNDYLLELLSITGFRHFFDIVTEK